MSQRFKLGIRRLRRMIQFAQAFPDENIVAALWRQLSWSHFRELLPLNKPFQRDFYAEMCRIEGWSTRTLRERIDSMLDKFQLGVRKLLEDFMIQRMADNDKIVMRYMDDGEFQRTVFRSWRGKSLMPFHAAFACPQSGRAHLWRVVDTSPSRRPIPDIP